MAIVIANDNTVLSCDNVQEVRLNPDDSAKVQVLYTNDDVFQCSFAESAALAGLKTGGGTEEQQKARAEKIKTIRSEAAASVLENTVKAIEAGAGAAGSVGFPGLMTLARVAVPEEA